MLLAVDIGNTNIAFGVFAGDELVQKFRAHSSRTRSADEYGVVVQQLLSLKGFDPKQIDAAILASVVPPLTDTVVEAVRQAVAREPMQVGPGLKTGISIRYDNPRDVGADRIVNAVAAHERFQSNVVVVDFGTATTFDCISAKAEYLGGVIVPGVKVSLDGLLARAAKLSRIEIAEPPSIIGRSTTHSLQSGVIYGYAALVDGVVAKLRAELGGNATVIATGDVVPPIVAKTTTLEHVDENLTLTGLRLLYERNVSLRAR